VVFSSVKAAQREGFKVLEFCAEYKLYVMEKDIRREAIRVKMCAFARPSRPAEDPS